MGITQHRLGTENVQQVANLLFLRGNIGRPGAGICPVRGHSNVQGDRTVGADEKPKPEFLDRLGHVFGFAPPRAHGHNVVHALEAMLDGRAKIFIGMGGNFAAAVPDKPLIQKAMRKLRLTVAVATKLNRGHLVHGQKALMLPCPCPQRDCLPEKRPTGGDGRGFYVDGARLRRPAPAGE